MNQSQLQTMSNIENDSVVPFVRIIEQPARGGTRFRYECEGRSAGSIPGFSSTPENTTYPAIQVMNYSGSALVIVSCVTKDFPYRQHPHNLVGERCSHGICKMIIDNKDTIATFASMGIQCAKRNDIRVRLKRRQSLQIDPFECGFEHMHCSSFEINLSAVRLCFQVMLEDTKTGQYTIALQPIVSDVIFDKKSCNELNVIDISTNTISPNGSKLMLFTSFVMRDDIEVQFYRTDSQNNIIWRDFGIIAFIYRHIGISLLTPKYPEHSTEQISDIYLQLRRPSDQEISPPIKLKMIPIIMKDNMNISQYNYSNTKISMRSLELSPVLASPKKKFCAPNDSWKAIAKKKPDFPFPILKAAIKRDNIVKQKADISSKCETIGESHEYFNKLNKTEEKLIHNFKTQMVTKSSMDQKNSTEESSIKNIVQSDNYNNNDNEQELVIDLTTGFDASKHSYKMRSNSIDEFPTQIISQHNLDSSNNYDSKMDFSCQVNTIELSELNQIDDQISNSN